MMTSPATAAMFEAVSDSVSHPSAAAQTRKTRPIMAKPIVPRIHRPSFSKGLASLAGRGGILGPEPLVGQEKSRASTHEGPADRGASALAVD